MRREHYLPPFRHTIEEEEIAEVVDTLKSDWVTTGPKTKDFEERFKKYLGCRHAVAVNSCTAALHLSLAACGISHKDEVITSPFTFAATAEVIIHRGATPKFADIERETFNIDPVQIVEKISERTRAIIPVHYAGHPCEMDEIKEIAEDHDLVVIEDAAHALGASYKKKKIGTIGDSTCFSFYATKNITTGEGGMLATDKDEIAEKASILSLHGISKDAWKRYSSEGAWAYEILFAGYKYNMSDMQAAIGIHQLRKIERMQNRRAEIARKYNKALADIPEIVTPTTKRHVVHAWHLYPILINPDLLTVDRNEFVERLRSENIGTSVHFKPLHLHPYYRTRYAFSGGEFPNSEEIFSREVSLPLYPRMTDQDVMDVVEAIERIADDCAA
jgi:dTDP-4-amino-4,6-dideoxygalactose transaminase